MNGFAGLLTVAMLMSASNAEPGADLPQPREAPPPGQRGPESGAEENNDKNPAGGADATLSAPINGALATISGTGLQPVCLTCPKAPLFPPLAWTDLRPPNPPVVDCRAGAWQQIYVPLAGQTSVPHVAPSPPLRVGYPWFRCCHTKVCSQGIGNWKLPPTSIFFAHCYYCNARCCGYGAGGCCKGPGAP